MYFKRNNDIHPADIMILELSKGIEDGDTVFYGVSSLLPMVAAKYAKRTHAPNLTLLNIPGGVNSEHYQMSDYSSAGSEQWLGSEAIFSLENVFDLSMRNKLDVAFLSGVQFDKAGHVNASVIGDYDKPKVRLPGGAGSAVLIPTVKKALIWRTKHDKKTFVEKTDFITTTGNIKRLVTPLCTFELIEGELKVISISPLSSKEEIMANTGFSLDFSLAKQLEYPSHEELSLLQRIDPKGVRYLEF